MGVSFSFSDGGRRGWLNQGILTKRDIWFEKETGLHQQCDIDLIPADGLIGRSERSNSKLVTCN